ncbi:hypothetical protein V6N13_009363 [Hibiscus sabdariffa]|uniref:Zinc knuckle CX2CX4HX4C domain-containing protein n=2 Tax=Hibiscus sabdariffa TaxID=183260 RepID=A0ABR1ZZ27_9ROSI
MASNSFLNHLQDLDFTNEEQGMIYTPIIQWDSSNDDSTLLVIEIRNDILSSGPWTFKNDWLALAAFNPNYSIDDYNFTSMNIWVRIHGVHLILMDDDNIGHHSGDSLGAMIGNVIKVDTHRIDLNMIDYLRIGIVLDVTKLVHRCVAIGGTSPSPKVCPLQYERLPTLCHGCGIIGHSLEYCPTFKPTPTSKLLYGDWIRYIPPRKQEAIPRFKSNIRYMDEVDNPNPKTTTNVGKPLNISQPIEATKVSNMVADVESTNVPTNFVAAITTTPNTPIAANNTTPSTVKEPITVADNDATNVPKTPVDPNTTTLHVVVFEQQLVAATTPCGNTVAPAC